jgi:hypothetical protein
MEKKSVGVRLTEENSKVEAEILKIQIKQTEIN